MRAGHFVEGLSNEARFLTALKEIEHRGAPEANWMLVEGDPGYGKSNLLMRHAIRNRDARIAMVRAKAGWTPKWALTDLADALNVQRAHSTQALEDAIIADLMEKQSRPGFCVIVDEIDHAARNVRVLETLRDLTDTAECVLIAGGMKGVSSKLKAHRQIHSRVDQFVEFHPATIKDVRLMCDALAEIKIADDLVAAVAERLRIGPVLLAPTGWRLQPSDPADFARHLADRVDAGPADGITEFGGPQEATFAELAEAWHRAKGRSGRIRNVHVPGQASAAFRAGAQVVAANALLGARTWPDWLQARLAS